MSIWTHIRKKCCGGGASKPAQVTTPRKPKGGK